ncbi:hypothetical protein Pint_24361 [Pistacia integerrima]|uniref:Uncharacterized protein n=1 Tax=Pistacia integerrima TaxID=434235 RepID=A0ACC0Y9W3_9ROSI|nr:hypothetical protein Pint_24361 [Pistacia integerrima]
MEPLNIQMMPLTISLFAFIFFFNPEQVVCFSTDEATMPSDPAVDPWAPLLPPPQPSPPNSPPVASSPDDHSPSSSPDEPPPFQPIGPIQYVNFPLPSSWNQQPNSPPVASSPADRSPSSSPDEPPPFFPIQYVNFPLPSSWNRPLSAPSPRRMPKPPAPSPSRKDPPLIARSRGQFLSTTPHSGSLFSRNSKFYHPPSIPSETNNIPEITKICNSTDRPALCVKFITPLYSSDTLSVLDKTITATAHQIKLARAAITNLAKTPTLQSTKQSDYQDCKESYEDALENLQNAKNAIPQLDIGTINSMLSAAVTDFSDCDDFSNNPHILKFDDILRNLVSTCLVVASSIK